MKKLFIIVVAALFVSECILTKVVTVPMRITGAIINGVENVIVKSADVIDEIPI